MTRRSKLKASTSAHLDGRIHWLGRLKNEELPAIMNQSRAFVLCSFIEGQPRVLIEAMACGMPIIGSNVRGIRSVIQHNVTGYLCDTDTENIAAAIRTVLSKPELMRKLGANARQYALEHYALEQQVRREYELLCNVVQRLSRAQRADAARGILAAAQSPLRYVRIVFAK